MERNRGKSISSCDLVNRALKRAANLFSKKAVIKPAASSRVMREQRIVFKVERGLQKNGAVADGAREKRKKGCRKFKA